MVTPAERDVMTRLLASHAERFSDAGHTMQFVTNEHRGHCRHDRCAPSCLGNQQLLHDACDLLEAELQRPQQAALWDADPSASSGHAGQRARPERGERVG